MTKQPTSSRGALALALAYAAHYRCCAMFGTPQERDGWFRAWAREMGVARRERQYQTRTASVAYLIP